METAFVFAEHFQDSLYTCLRTGLTSLVYLENIQACSLVLFSTALVACVGDCCLKSNICFCPHHDFPTTLQLRYIKDKKT